MNFLLLSLLILPAVIDASPEELLRFHNITHFKFAKYWEGMHKLKGGEKSDRLSFACLTLFCHLGQNAKCVSLCEEFAKLETTDAQFENMITLNYKEPSKNEKDCANKFATIFGKNHSVLAPLCAFHHSFKDHEELERKIIEFGKISRAQENLYNPARNNGSSWPILP